MKTRNRQPTRSRPRILTWVAALLTALIAASLSVAAVAVATPASATSCQTQGHIYVINPTSYPGTYVKFEYDAVDGPTFDFSLQADTNVSFQLGGNGLAPGVAPYWQVFDQNGAYVKTATGSNTGSNCVSNQRYFSDSGSLGTVHTYRAVYQAGNSGANVYQQAHFRFVYDRPAPLPDPDPDPNPDPCGRLLICL